jgi:predicted transcriptional regulator
MKVLLSIKPEFVDEIASGRKKYEYRKNVFKRDDITSVVVYATKPLGKVVGEFEIEQIISDDPMSVWKRTKAHSGITEEFFKEYFSDHDTAFAIKIKDFKAYDIPIELNDFSDTVKVPPQSFCYIE